MSFREKTAWISLVAFLGLITWYFQPFLRGEHSITLSFPRLAIAGAVVLLLSIGVRMVVAAFSPREAKAPLDEREKLIEMKSRQFSYAVLAWAVRIICFVGISNPALFFNANTLLFFLMISEVMGLSYQIVEFRRGA
jgi:hypothetical protein